MTYLCIGGLAQCNELFRGIMRSILLFQTCRIVGRFASVADMCDARLLKAYELEDDSYAHSTRATTCAEFLAFCKAVLWMKKTFTQEDAYGELIQDVSTDCVSQNIEMAMGLRAALHTKARHIKVSISSHYMQLPFISSFVPFTVINTLMC